MIRCGLSSILSSDIYLEDRKMTLSMLGFNQNNELTYFLVETSGGKLTHVRFFFEKYLVLFVFLSFAGIINPGVMILSLLLKIHFLCMI